MSGLYYYTARSERGAFVRGSLEASSEQAALSGLRSRALFVTSIAPSHDARAAAGAVFQLGPVSQQAMVTAFRALAVLVQAGVPLHKALSLALEQCNDSRLREAFAAASSDVENGLPLSDAFACRPREFPRLFVAMLRAGELGGVLDEVLDRLAGVLERDRALRKRIVAALTYPLVVSCASLCLVAFLLVSIVPMFQAMYEQMHVALPPVTAALIAAGDAVRAPVTWLAGAVLCAAAAVAVYAGTRTGAVKCAIDAVALRIPVFGTMKRKTAAARTARMLGTLLRSGVALAAAIEVVADAAGSGAYRQNFEILRRALDEGSPLSGPLLESGLYEPVFVQLVRVGEETGTLDAMLLRVADYYDTDVEAALAALGSLIEPAMILTLGGAVGFIVSAIFIPLYTLIGNMK